VASVAGLIRSGAWSGRTGSAGSGIRILASRGPAARPARGSG